MTQTPANIGSSKRLRDEAATLLRIDAARDQQQASSQDHPLNGDEQRYATENYIASYTKGLPHDQNAEVDPEAYRALLQALAVGTQPPLDALTLGCPNNTQRRLVSPLGAFTFQFQGRDSHGLTMPAPPTFESAEEAGEIAEAYWQALTRDVPFANYDTDPLTIAAAAGLSDNYSDFRGPKENGRVTTRTLFRVDTPGDLSGPFISQLLTQPFVLGALVVDQRYRTPLPGIDYVTEFSEYRNSQNGCQPTSQDQFDPTRRFIFNSRSLGEYIHRDPPLSHFYYAAGLIFNNYGTAALDPGNPYINNPTQEGFTTFGLPDLTDLCAKVAIEALKAAWYQKWLVHRRLRPEVYAGWIDNIKSGRDTDYPVNAEILADTDLLERVFGFNKDLNLQFNRGMTGSYLLAQAFPEASPLHPSYPSGHATYAGAGVTVLKAVFNEEFVVPAPLVSNAEGTELVPYAGELTLGGELNKFASNIGFGRDFTGVHWRTDGVEGQRLGEAVAIAYLQDQVRLYREDFGGYTLRKFDGEQIRIERNGTISTLS